MASGQGGWGWKKKGYAFSLMLKIAAFLGTVWCLRTGLFHVCGVCVSPCVFVCKLNYQFLTNSILSISFAVSSAD